MNIILASASPRRQELLNKIVNNFDIIPSSCEEIIDKDTKISDVAEKLAFQKAVDVWKSHKDSLVIGADTIVISENQILGKPKDTDDAKRMLKMLSGKEHYVITGVALMSNKRSSSFSMATKVKFSDLTENEIDWYISTNEPMDKAGAYGIQGFGSLFVEQIQGDYFNVMGLPINELYRHIMKICPEDCIISQNMKK